MRQWSVAWRPQVPGALIRNEAQSGHEACRCLWRLRVPRTLTRWGCGGEWGQRAARWRDMAQQLLLQDQPGQQPQEKALAAAPDKTSQDIRCSSSSIQDQTSQSQPTTLGGTMTRPDGVWCPCCCCYSCCCYCNRCHCLLIHRSS